MIGVYVHIPYCRTICPYCDFVKLRSRSGVPESFVDALVTEIAAFEGPRAAGSVFFGGGTPSQLNARQTEQVMQALRDAFDLPPDAEITLEANPDDVTPDLAAAWRACGINRISLGVQSFDDRVLRKLGRRHGAEGARRACAVVCDFFENWNLDLIFGAQPIEAWPETLLETRAIAPPHVAGYGLTYEPGTPFEKRAAEAVDDETSLRLYQQMERILADYDHYEISNFARQGRASRHNLIYWHNGEYAGFGPGAYSFLGGVRARNTPLMERYLQKPGTQEEAIRLTAREIKVETLIQHLRLRAGLRLADYAARFGVPVEADFEGELEFLTARGLIERTTTHLRPTAQGFYLNNEIGLALVG